MGDMVVYIENSDGNTNVRFHQADTHERFFSLLDSKKISVNHFRADCGSCSKEIVSEIEKHCKHLSFVFSLFSELLLKPLVECHVGTDFLLVLRLGKCQYVAR